MPAARALAPLEPPMPAINVRASLIWPGLLVCHRRPPPQRPADATHYEPVLWQHITSALAHGDSASIHASHGNRICDLDDRYHCASPGPLKPYLQFVPYELTG